MQTPPPELMAKFDELNSWRNLRTQQYGNISDQLNLLFDDIDAGLFGEQAKQGLWYQHIKSVKQSVQKPDTDAIEAEIAELIANSSL